jgi:RimJ/RimL family protein N-acetyltransferase
MTDRPGVPALAAAEAHETALLRLRLFAERDLDALAAIYADPDSMRYIGEGRTISRSDTWRAIAAMLGHWALRGYGMWALELKATGETIGRAGFIDSEGWPEFELGWQVARAHWGHGYAPEAAAFALGYARTRLGRRRVASLIRPGNAASIRVAEKLGMRRDGQLELLGGPVLRYAAGDP